MTRLRTSGRPRGRRVIGRTLLAAALLTAVAAVPAAAVVPQGAPAAATARAAAPAYEQVVHFYGAYIDAVAAEDGGELASSLRDFYLTPGLRAELGDWEEAHGADGVLHAQNAPAGFRVSGGDSGAGHTWSTVRLTWGAQDDPAYTYLKVRSDLATGKISGIRE
ncbi:hypothetical protein OG345_27005 [Streptomyces sp. NBC_01220]|uniref:hypothetical protein n=1 Tax=unclassified Streptomyces TaxID=2593676 RepID=UPI002E32DC66|nr:hypothetical protein [Streptomyces sp. NBC_01358]WSQ46379.1 hypothetical protein OG345_27005 [Streptomyces sp. NBC_01220]